MATTIDISELYNKAFGVSVPEYKLDALPKVDATKSSSIYGTPFYGSNYVTGAYYFLPAFFDLQDDSDYTIPFPIIRIQSQKRIIETPLTERKGTVVELVNQESWKIYIKGFIISKDGNYPEQEILKMKEVYEVNTALRLRCALTDLFLTADDRVCIKSLNFPEVKGIEHVKPYEMELISVNIFDLTDLTPLG
jgi:hypothetical protein